MADKRKDQFCNFYRDLVKNGKNNTTRVFERKVRDGCYYTAHGDAALFIADEFFKTREVIKYLGNEPKLAGITMNRQKLSKVIKHTLIDRQENFELYGRANENSSVWHVTKKATPGNLKEFEEFIEIDGAAGSAAVMAVKVANGGQNQKVVGVAFGDSSMRTLEVCEFVDDQKFSNFASVLVQRGAQECLLCVDKATISPSEMQKLRSLIESCNIPITDRKPGDFKGSDIEQDLGRLVPSLEQHLPKLELKHAMGGVVCLIKYLELLRDESGFGHFKLLNFDLSQYMKLDKCAVDALNLFPTPSDHDKNSSLYGLLNKGRTAMGSRLLSQWLKQPLLNMEQIERRLNLVEAFTQDAAVRQSLQEDHLHKVPDLDRMENKFQRGKATLQTVVDLYRFTITLPGLTFSLQDYRGSHQKLLQDEFIAKLEAVVKDLSQFEAMVEQTIDLDAVERHEYLINPSFDNRLEDLRDDKERVFNNMKSLQERVADDLGLDPKHVKLNWTAQLGDHFRVSRKDEKKLRGKKKYTSLETRKDGVRFTSMKMKKLSGEHAGLKEQYEEIQAEIVEKAMEIVVTYVPVLMQVKGILAELDVIVSFAHVSVNSPTPYCRPKLHPLGGKSLKLVQSRHPCMEVMDGVTFIPNDCQMERGKSNVQVITGPNMGGKSTYIRQIGVICLMAQIGCFVPCETAEMPLIDCILARVGAGDSQLKGVSTFMKEMLEAAAILHTATANSLLIIDELGRGTSTYDGFGLAWAISEHIAREIGAFTMFATHFHELTALATAEPSVINRHVTAHTDNDSITMLYLVNDGACDRSFGIHVSKLANFPGSVVEMARKKAAELENFGNQAGLDMMANDVPTTEEDERPNSSAKRSKLHDGTTARLDPATRDALKQFLADFDEKPISSMDDDELGEHLKLMRSSLQSNSLLAALEN